MKIQTVPTDNGRISEVIGQTRSNTAEELETALVHHLATCNHRIAQRAISHLSPAQAFKQWRAKRPELFNKRVQELAGLDTYASRTVRPEHLQQFLPGPGAGS